MFVVEKKDGQDEHAQDRTDRLMARSMRSGSTKFRAIEDGIGDAPNPPPPTEAEGAICLDLERAKAERSERDRAEARRHEEHRRQLGDDLKALVPEKKERRLGRSFEPIRGWNVPLNHLK